MRYLNVDYQTVIDKYQLARSRLRSDGKSMPKRTQAKRETLMTILDEMERATSMVSTCFNGRVRVRARTADIAGRVGLKQSTFIQEYLVPIKNLTGLIYEFEDYTMKYDRH